jgi:ubiquinone biosynthesis protein
VGARPPWGFPTTLALRFLEEELMSLPKMVRNLFRAQEILTVFFRFGFGDMVERTGLIQYLKKVPPQDEAAAPQQMTPARRFRNALEELGGAFVKLGQVLSTRPDILPASWIEELAHLQDEVAAIDFELIRQDLEKELGPLSDHFLSVNPVPLATASVAQVHEAVTLSGDKVVVKSRKPGIKEIILQDCDILDAIAELLEKHVQESRIYGPTRIVQEFRTAVTEELDFTREGQNLDRFRSDFGPDATVTFPAVYWDQTTERVLTMEYVVGLKTSLTEKLRDAGVDAPLVARRLAEAILRQILEFGFFHGDPHPGNLLVIEGDRICFLDCGMVGRLDGMLRENLVLVVSAGLRKDVGMVADILTDMQALPDDVDRNQFIRQTYLLLERYYNLPLKRVRMDALMNDLIGIIHTFRIRVPSDIVLVAKALITLEGVGRTLDPEFDSVSVAQPYVQQIVMTTYGPRFLARRIREGASDMLRLIRSLPSDIREMSRILRENRLKIILEHTGQKEQAQALERASKQLCLCIVIAALVLGSSIMAHAQLEPRFFGVPLIALIGFGIAAALGLGQVLSGYFGKKP